uniref:N-carbamoyl-D-amino acid amidohydrolase n=1 Tax=Agrobacterium tumefaciens TaxID=358 RepID=UPI00005DB3CD|nr:Chain A, N-carbamoyl-D-amino acid amidohydrolase [Agrobacterium tumefaciens]2GGL_B Chain B, N-carbamoyl-D-amino acid amidohydrolase [Agrobacterium tumefaciens]2GGL_C Chain C, N-carbamoyl-D-amino acid amidohydrolase [Agrobacterium tumefaciens]2GGL_D Chain D, N-carbamoyl-D-amino acid amidohydrolase [Agrobacterium tumefaciens]
MTRQMILAVGQQGPIARAETREQVVGRLLDMLTNAASRGVNFIVFPELALTTFFPRWHFTDEAELDSFYETEMPGPVVRPLFETAAELGIGFNLGYAELVVEGGVKRRFNTSILVDKSGKIVGKYRKIHLPGHKEYEAYRPFQHLEKRYFEPGDLGFPVYDVDAAKMGMFICNDRRWPETWRVMGLKGAEIICGGYNTPTHNPPVPQHDHLTSFHHLLSMQCGSYQNGAWSAAAGKVGMEEGCMLLGHSCIVAPTGEIVALTTTLEDEVITAALDLDRCRELREHIFNFKAHRQPQHYGLIAEF